VRALRSGEAEGEEARLLTELFMEEEEGALETVELTAELVGALGAEEIGGMEEEEGEAEETEEAEETDETEEESEDTAALSVLLSEEELLSRRRICSTRITIPPASTVGRMDPVSSASSPT
jgi:hypothetical protein